MAFPHSVNGEVTVQLLASFIGKLIMSIGDFPVQSSLLPNQDQPLMMKQINIQHRFVLFYVNF
jgi:hypothetical protein